jgi:hypothetical protein
VDLDAHVEVNGSHALHVLPAQKGRAVPDRHHVAAVGGVGQGSQPVVGGRRSSSGDWLRWGKGPCHRSRQDNVPPPDAWNSCGIAVQTSRVGPHAPLDNPADLGPRWVEPKVVRGGFVPGHEVRHGPQVDVVRLGHQNIPAAGYGDGCMEEGCME